jgi:hypothetical protein
MKRIRPTVHNNTAIGVVIAVITGVEVTSVFVATPFIDRAVNSEPQYHKPAI